MFISLKHFLKTHFFNTSLRNGNSFEGDIKINEYAIVNKSTLKGNLSISG